jgi:hypothetical protein
MEKKKQRFKIQLKLKMAQDGGAERVSVSPNTMTFGPGHCGLRGAPSSMVVEPVTSCRGPTSQRVSLNPGKPELA